MRHDRERAQPLSPLESEVLVGMLVIFGYDITTLFEIAVVAIVAYAVGTIVTYVLKKTFERTPFPESIENGIVRISKYVVYFIALLAVLSVSGIDLTSVIVGLGAFSIAISFALSTILQNFVSGLLIQGDKPFKVGEVIKVQSFEGKVIQIGIRTTVIQIDDRLIYIPNSVFVSNAVENKTRIAKSGDPAQAQAGTGRA